MQNPYTQYIEQMMFFDTKVPEVLYKIRDIAATRFGLANVSLEKDFGAFDRTKYSESIDNDISEVLVRNTYDIQHYTNNPLMKRSRTFFKTASPEFWSKFSLLILIPERTVTNEENKKIKIKNLFVRVPLTPDGKLAGKFEYLKTWFTNNQYDAGYIHSHCTRFDRSHIFSWHHVCTGGGPDTPINTTISKLRSETFNHIVWECFFWELEKATGSESLTGGPYIRMSSVRSSTTEVKVLDTISQFAVSFCTEKWMKELLKRYITAGKFKVVYNNGNFTISESFVSWLKDFTAFYIENKDISKHLPLSTEEFNIFNDHLYKKEDRRRRTAYRENNTKMLDFNGTPYYLTIVEDSIQEGDIQTLISPNAGYTILNYLLNILNTKLANIDYEKGPETERRETKEIRDSFYSAHYPKIDTKDIKFY